MTASRVALLSQHQALPITFALPLLSNVVRMAGSTLTFGVVQIKPKQADEKAAKY